MATTDYKRSAMDIPEETLFTISPKVRAEMMESRKFLKNLKKQVIRKDKYLIEEPVSIDAMDAQMIGFMGPLSLPTKTREMTKDEIIKHLETELSLVTRKFDKIKDYLGPEMYESIIELETYLAKYRCEV